MKKYFLLSTLLLSTSFVKADEGSCGFGMMGFGNWSYFSMILGIIFWVIVLYSIYLLIKKLSNGNINPLEIIKKRYAKGEITKKEFERMKKELR